MLWLSFGTLYIKHIDISFFNKFLYFLELLELAIREEHTETIHCIRYSVGLLISYKKEL